MSAEGRQQHAQLEGDGDKRLPRGVGFALHDQRIVDAAHPPLHEHGNRHARGGATSNDPRQDRPLHAHGLIDAVDREG